SEGGVGVGGGGRWWGRCGARAGVGWVAARGGSGGRDVPPTPASVIDLGCGPFGGFVPALRRAGYDALGVDAEAPDEPGYYRVDFERFAPARPAHAVVRSTSLHHTVDPHEGLGQGGAALRPRVGVPVGERGARR